MFTGIIETVARVASVEDRAGSRRLTFRIRNDRGVPAWKPVELGESIALSGVCLTAVASRLFPDGGEVSFEAVPETLSRTTLGRLTTGDPVNVERSLAVGDRFGGHYVTGHIDGEGKIRVARPEGDQVLFEVAVGAEVLVHVIPKGSIAVDGISLTVIGADRAAGTFTFAAIPHTLAHTTLGARRPGDPVNIETDAFGKWVFRALEEILGTPPNRATDARGERLLGLLEDAGRWSPGAHDPGSPKSRP